MMMAKDFFLIIKWNRKLMQSSMKAKDTKIFFFIHFTPHLLFNPLLIPLSCKMNSKQKKEKNHMELVLSSGVPVCRWNRISKINIFLRWILMPSYKTSFHVCYYIISIPFDFHISQKEWNNKTKIPSREMNTVKRYKI